ncbi:hypothetical protein [Desulfocurvus sp. DL9XJH121]
MAGFLRRLFGRAGARAEALEKDPSLGRMVAGLLENCEYALCAGDGAADLAVHLARRFPQREILACEPKSELCHRAMNSAGQAKNAYLHNVTPAQFLGLVETDKPYLLDKDVLVVLNAAGGGAERRFFDEVSFVASRFAAAYLLVLGCRVPGRDEFAFESHRGRECSLKNLAPSLGGSAHSVFVPGYEVPGSRRRAVAGWCLIALGRNASAVLPEEAAALAAKPE